MQPAHASLWIHHPGSPPTQRTARLARPPAAQPR
jgi:hypothetical protein